MNEEEQARYKAILTEHSKLYTENKKLKDKVSYLKERVAYLERSNNRREETILYLREENDELHNKIDKYKDLEQSLTFIKNRVKQGMTQENINKCAIQLVNSYLKDSDVDDN